MTIYDDIRENAGSAEGMVSNQFEVTQGWATTMMNQTLAFLDAMDAGSSFTVPTLSLSHALPTDLDIEDFLVPAPGEFTLSYTTPVRPTVSVAAIDSIFLFAGTNYSSTVDDAVIAKLLDVFNNGGTGLSAAVEDAIFARAVARKATKDAAMYVETEDYFAARGWVLPTGMLSGRLLEIQREISREDQQINYEIMVKQAELADQNTRHNLEQALAWEGLARDYYIKNELKDLEVSKAISVARVQEFTSRVDAAKVSLEVYGTDVQAMVALIDAQTKAYLGEVQAYTARADAYKATVDAKAAVFKAQADVVKTEADIELGELDARLKAYLGLAQLDAAKAEAAAKIAAQVAAGAMSAVNAGVSFSYGASQSASGSYNTSYSYATDVQEILYSYE